MKIKAFTYSLLLACLMLAATSCDSPDNSQERKKALDELREIKKSYLQDQQNIEKAQDLDVAYKRYIERYPEDTVNAILYYEDAKLHVGPLSNIDQAIVQLGNAHSAFPSAHIAAEAMYMHGALLMQIGQEREALKLFKKLIADHPNSEYAPMARAEIANEGRSLEQILKEKGPDDSLRNQDNDSLTPRPN